MLNKREIRFCLDKMGEMFPDAHCELNHRNPFELVIAVATFRSMYRCSCE